MGGGVLQLQHPFLKAEPSLPDGRTDERHSGGGHLHHHSRRLRRTTPRAAYGKYVRQIP